MCRNLFVSTYNLFDHVEVNRDIYSCVGTISIARPDDAIEIAMLNEIPSSLEAIFFFMPFTYQYTHVQNPMSKCENLFIFIYSNYDNNF